MSNDYTEDALIEQPAIELFRQLDWDTANCYDETFPNSFLGRETSSEVVLVARLRELVFLSMELFSQALISSDLDWHRR